MTKNRAFEVFADDEFWAGGSKNQDVLAHVVKLLMFQMEPQRMQQQRPAEVVVVMNQGRNLSDPPDGDRLLRAAVRDAGQSLSFRVSLKP